MDVSIENAPLFLESIFENQEMEKRCLQPINGWQIFMYIFSVLNGFPSLEAAWKVVAEIESTAENENWTLH